MDKLTELPSRFQGAFQTERAKAELEYSKRAEQFPHHPHFADGPLHRVLLIQKVFFAFCKQARGAWQAGDWTSTQVAEAVDAAWPPICDFYVVREQGALPEEVKAKFRTVLWRVVNDDPQWKQHLSDLAALPEGPRAAVAVPRKSEHADNAVSKAEGVALNGEVTEVRLADTTTGHGSAGGNTTGEEAMADSTKRDATPDGTTTQEAVTEFEEASADSLDEPGWVRVNRHDWREDAAYARENPPALLRPVKAARLLAMETLHKRAKEAIRNDAPKTPHDTAGCLRPALSAYTEELFDKLAEAKLRTYRSGVRPRTYGQWLRSKGQSAVVEDVCRTIVGQFQVTVRQIAESIPDSGGEGGTTRRALWGVLCAEWEPHSFSRDLADRLRIDLEDRSLYWEAKSLNSKAGDFVGHVTAIADNQDPVVAPIPKNKRGRPQIIADKLKAAGAALKASGGSNRQVAAKLYSTKYPTQQQVKNVSSILRHYLAKGKKAASTGPQQPKSSRKPNKNRG
jgi:hypothetical protein